ncbi:MAG: diaminopimelate decarboxylase, partial [Gemmatimonadetes bacterium]
MTVLERVSGSLAVGGVPLDRAFASLRRLEPHAHGGYVYDLERLEGRARRFRAAFAPLSALSAFALKANSLPAILECLRRSGMGGEAGSLGELELAGAAGFGPDERILNGNGRTLEEAEWVAGHGVHSVNADHVDELDLLQRAAARAGRTVRVALRVNPGIVTSGHRYVATGREDAKFGVAPDEALAAWSARARWPGLQVDGVHIHVGSQLLDARPLEQAVDTALSLADESQRRGAPLSLVNLGGGFGIDYSGSGSEFPLEDYAGSLARRVEGRRGPALQWVFEPGRWVAAPVGLLLCEVLWIKHRGGLRFVVLAAGMNDLLRPALYHARHRIVPVRPRPGPEEPATVVGPVCESADVFAEGVPLPPLEPGDLVALLDTGAYGATMASNYNGRGRLAELVVDR